MISNISTWAFRLIALIPMIIMQVKVGIIFLRHKFESIILLTFDSFCFVIALIDTFTACIYCKWNIRFRFEIF